MPTELFHCISKEILLLRHFGDGAGLPPGQCAWGMAQTLKTPSTLIMLSRWPTSIDMEMKSMFRTSCQALSTGASLGQSHAI